MLKCGRGGRLIFCNNQVLGVCGEVDWILHVQRAEGNQVLVKGICGYWDECEYHLSRFRHCLTVVRCFLSVLGQLSSRLCQVTKDGHPESLGECPFASPLQSLTPQGYQPSEDDWYSQK